MTALPSMEVEIIPDETHERLWHDGCRIRGEYLRRHLVNGVLWSDLQFLVELLHRLRVKAKHYYIYYGTPSVRVRRVLP